MDKSIPQVEYGQDIQEMARSADGPFSTRVPNSSDTALLYATVPDPSKPIEFKTSLEPASLAQAYELAHEPAKVASLEPQAREATEMSPASGTNSAVSWQPTRMNPFSLPNTYENGQFLFRFLRLLLGKDEALPPEAAAKEDEAIHEAIEGIYTLEPRYRRLKYVSLPAYLQMRLKRWREGGQYGHIFDNEHDTIRFTHLQTFEFQGMEKDIDVLVPLCFYITQRFDQIVYDKDQAARMKVLIIDEAWRWMLHGDMGPYMIDKLKTGRKNNLCNLFITQSGLDADRAGFGELLNEACPMKVFFANSEI